MTKKRTLATQKMLMQKVKDTLLMQDEHLTDEDRKALPLVTRLTNAVTQIWDANQEPIHSLTVYLEQTDIISFSVNNSIVEHWISRKIEEVNHA